MTIISKLQEKNHYNIKQTSKYSSHLCLSCVGIEPTTYRALRSVKTDNNPSNIIGSPQTNFQNNRVPSQSV